ncbi:7 transmembrane receptor, partial [Ancylostoma duodenale]
MITTTLTTIIFMRHNSTPVVKSTTRELSYIILSGQFHGSIIDRSYRSIDRVAVFSGIMTCYAVTFSILAKPSSVSCFLTRIIPPIAFSIVYSALLTKTNRIARILAGSKKRILTKKPRFLSTFSQVGLRNCHVDTLRPQWASPIPAKYTFQVVITWILVGIQSVIVAVGVLQEWPSAGFSSHYLPHRYGLVLVCSTSSGSFLTPFLWNLFLISLCTLY